MLNRAIRELIPDTNWKMATPPPTNETEFLAKFVKQVYRKAVTLYFLIICQTLELLGIRYKLRLLSWRSRRNT